MEYIDSARCILGNNRHICCLLVQLNKIRFLSGRHVYEVKVLLDGTYSAHRTNSMQINSVNYKRC